MSQIKCNLGGFLENIPERLTCAQISLKRQYTILQPGWRPSNQRQNFRLRANVERANLYVIIHSIHR